jgi:hypothetical protein
MMAFRGWSDGVADVTAEVTCQDAESRAARRIERLASSFFRLDATRATPPRVVECHPWWFVSLRANSA